MVLILTNEEDRTADRVESEFKERGTEFVRLDTGGFGTDFQIGFAVSSSTPEVHIRTSEKTFDGEEVESIWYRRPVNPQPSEALTDPEAREFASNELQSLLYGALQGLDCRWVSHPSAIQMAEYKLHQLTIASDLGFDIPETCVSMDPEQVRAFYHAQRQSDGRTAAKLVSKGPPHMDDFEEQYIVYTTTLEDEDLASDTALSVCPAIYQEYIEKAYELRVTVVGEQAFACAIHSQESEQTKIDWRRYDFENTPHEVHELDADLKTKCIEIVRRFGLRFSALDLIVRPDGKVFFLELNPNGQWGWIEEMTGLPITAAIADLLTGEA